MNAEVLTTGLGLTDIRIDETLFVPAEPALAAELFYPVAFFQIGLSGIGIRSTTQSGYVGGAGTFEVNGKTADLYYRNFVTSGNRNELDYCNASFSPLQFYAYATKSGAPVYDTTTGALLPDVTPLS